MLSHGKIVNYDYRQTAKIQEKMNNTPQLPENTRTDLSKKEKSELNDLITNDYNSLDAYGFQNNTLLGRDSNTKERRKERYITYEEMDECNFIHRGLQVMADDCSQKNTEGNVLKTYSDDDETKEILDNLWQRLNINKEAWSIIFETAKLGDNFYEVIPDSYSNPTMISRIRWLETDKVSRIEKNGKLAFYTYLADMSDPDQIMLGMTSDSMSTNNETQMLYKLEPWQIVHFRIEDKRFAPYGGSLLYSGVKTFRRLQLLEDGMVIYRLARTPERLVFKIDTGNLPASEANRQVQKIKDNYRTTQIMDDNGNINRTASALSLTQDIFIPVREGSNGTTIDTLQGGTAFNNIDDIRYFRDEILWTMNIPPEYLGFTSDQSGGSQGRGSLAMQDIKFSRFAERVQFSVGEGFNKLAAIELFFKKKKKSDLKNFRIELTPPSNIKELMDIEYLNQKMTLLQSMNGTGLFTKKFMLEYVMKLSKKEIDNLIFFKDLESQAAQAQENAMFGGAAMGGAPAGMDSTGTAPAPVDASGTVAPAASIETEEFEDKIVRLFGKEVLIENKEEWAKIANAYHEYEENKNINEDEDIEDEEFNSAIIEQLAEIMGNKIPISTNTSTASLIAENELGGLSFEDNSFKTFSLPKKKGNPKDGLLFEENKFFLNK